MDRYIKPVTKEDREFMQRLYRRAKKPKEQLKIICQLFPSYTKKQIKQTLGLEREITARDEKEYDMKNSYNQIKKPARRFDEATKAAAVKAVLVDGEKNVDVAERFAITSATLSNWCRKAKEKQLDYMKYADKVEEELTTEQDAATEGYNFDWQRLEKASAEWNVEQKLTNETAAEQDAAPEEEKTFPYSHFIPLAKCEPGVAEQCRAEEQSQPVYEYVEEGSKTATDEKAIKAAAYDVITIQMAMYPDSSTDTMMRFIQGVQALAQQLCDEVE